jgi:hypothetical protein
VLEVTSRSKFESRDVEERVQPYLPLWNIWSVVTKYRLLFLRNLLRREWFGDEETNICQHYS